MPSPGQWRLTIVEKDVTNEEKITERRRELDGGESGGSNSGRRTVEVGGQCAPEKHGPVSCALLEERADARHYRAFCEVVWQEKALNYS